MPTEHPYRPPVNETPEQREIRELRATNTVLRELVRSYEGRVESLYSRIAEMEASHRRVVLAYYFAVFAVFAESLSWWFR